MIYDYYKEKGKKDVGKTLITAVILLIILITCIAAVNIYLNIIQFNEIGNLSSVYLTNLSYKVGFFAISFIIIFAAISITTRFIKRNLVNHLHANNLEAVKFPNLSLAALFAFLGAFMSKENLYLKALSFINSTEFGSSDPLFNKDIGYYVLQRPFLMAVYDFFSSMWLFVILYTAAYYFIMLLSIYGNLTFQDLKIKSLIRHNLVNIAIFFLIKTFSYKFEREGILYSEVVNLQGVAINGAGYTEVNVWLNYFTVAPFLLIAIVGAAMWFIWKGNLKRAAYSIAVFPAVWLVVSIIATFVQSVIVSPNAISIEKPFMKYNMEKTREAYGIDKINVIDFQQVKELTPAVINRNTETKDNIRIVDYQATLDSNMQLQSNTNFYTFNDGDIINYTINGREVPVLISAREIDKNKLPEKSYINTMFQYTHGYGVVINPINRVTNEGQADFIVGGLKHKSLDPNLKVNEPRIYYGELTKDHVIVNPPEAQKLPEIDYDGTTGTNYNGKGGIKLGLFTRLLFAVKYGDPNLIISGNISSESKLLLNRNILDRAKKAVPFLTFDNDPYIVLTTEGRLVWVIDAYSTTSAYPYSQNYQNVNYIRNSVKVTVDAYDGTVKYYIIDRKDPLIETYRKIYPEVFSKEDLPVDIAQHSRYPEALFKIQTEMLKRYHLDPNKDPQNVSKFFSNQDLWSIAKYPANMESSARDADNTEVRDIEPYYNMIRLPKVGEKEELILMRPFTPTGKHNMVSWLAVRNSYNKYGELILFEFPKDTNILGPYQVEASINSNDTVSKDMTLWGQSGSRVFKGNLLVIPIEDSVLYVEPIYVQYAGQSSIPQVREIVVGYQRGEEFKLSVKPTLNEALNELLGVSPQTPQAPQAPQGQVTPTPTPAPAQPGGVVDNQKLINDILTKYDELRKQLDELDKAMSELRKR